MKGKGFAISKMSIIAKEAIIFRREIQIDKIGVRWGENSTDSRGG